MAPTAVIAGVGPGLGASIAHRFADEGWQVALLARSESYIEGLAADLSAGAGEGLAVPTDLRDPDAVEEAFATIEDAFGATTLLVNHASGGVWQGIDDLSLAELDRAWEIGVRGGVACTQAALPGMREAGGGTIIFTGATSSIRGREEALAFSSAKFGVRGLAQSLARELGPEGIHVAHVVVDGRISPPGREVNTPERFLDPDDVAERYWELARQDAETMDFEIHVTNGIGGATEFV